MFWFRLSVAFIFLSNFTPTPLPLSTQPSPMLLDRAAYFLRNNPIDIYWAGGSQASSLEGEKIILGVFPSLLPFGLSEFQHLIQIRKVIH